MSRRWVVEVDRHMAHEYQFRPWFLNNWMRAGLIVAVVTLALLPVLWNTADHSLLLILTLLPVYMIHQYEEHAHGRFVADFNTTIGKGLPVLTKTSAFAINVGGVWLLDLPAFYLAAYVDLGFALIPAYLMTVNAVVHVLGTLATRRYNPGLYTALALFIPWGVFMTVFISARTSNALAFNIFGLVVALAIHAGIVIFALRRRRELTASAQSFVRAAQ